MLAAVAHADAAEVEGELRGGAARLRGIRVSSSGLPEAQWNSADITGPEADLDAAREFFGDLPWGLRVPEGIEWSAGRWLLRQLLMSVQAGDLRRAADVPDLAVRTAGAADLEAVLAVDAEAFESDAEAQRPWTAPHLDAQGIEVALATLGTEPVATAYSIRSDGEAGAALLHADTPAAARVYARLGFGAAGALDIYEE
jgi:hypothetical protein